MQLSDRTNSHVSGWPGRAGELRSAEIISLDEWRRRHRPKMTLWRPTPILPAPVPPRRTSRVPVEASLLVLVVVSAFAGAAFTLMGLGYLP